MFDIGILGNGILGLGLAFRLKKDNPGLKLAVIGPSARKGGATVTAAAMLNVWAEIGEGLFEDSLLSKRFDIGRKGMEMWRQFADELEEVTGDDVDITWGTYVINTPMSAPWGDKTWPYFLESLRKKDVEHEVFEPCDIPYLNPSQTNRVLNAAKIPDGSLNILYVMSVLEKALKLLNVEVIDASATAIQTGNGDHKVVLDNAETLSAEKIVLANGTFAQSLIDQIPQLKQETPRLLWGAGSSLDLTFPDWVHRNNPDWSVFGLRNVLRTLNPVGACGLYLVPASNNTVSNDQPIKTFYVGASSAVLYEREWDPRIHASAFLMDHTMHEVNRNFFYTTVQLRGNGFRPMTLDGFPLLGESSIKGIWFLNGMKRDGLTSAPYLVQELAIDLAGGASSLPEEFKPVRKLLPYKDQESSINETVMYSLNGDRQHGLSMPAWMDDKFLELKRKEVIEVYDKRQITDYSIHPEVVHIFADDQYYKGCNPQI